MDNLNNFWNNKSTYHRYKWFYWIKSFKIFAEKAKILD